MIAVVQRGRDDVDGEPISMSTDGALIPAVMISRDSGYVAGASALLLAHGRTNGLGWGPAEVKAALMGTARPAVDSHDPLKVGAGIIDLSRAMSPPALAMPFSLSFGLARPVGNHAYSLTLALANTSGSAQTYALSALNSGAGSIVVPYLYIIDYNR